MLFCSKGSYLLEFKKPVDDELLKFLAVHRDLNFSYR